MKMNKNVLLTIMGAALLGASRKREKGSSSNIELMLKLGGYSDGKIRVVATVVYEPYADWRNQAREPKHYFDLHEYINPAIDAVVDLRQYAIENNEELEDEVDLDVIDVETYYYDEYNIFDTYDSLPEIEDQVDVSGIESVSYHDWDIFGMIREEEGMDDDDDIPNWMYEDRLDDLIEYHSFKVEFIFDPAKILKSCSGKNLLLNIISKG